jgi:hypothetical protein
MCRFFDRLNLCQLLWLINQNETQIALYFIVMAFHLLGNRPYVVEKIFFNVFACFTATLSQAQLYALVNQSLFSTRHAFSCIALRPVVPFLYQGQLNKRQQYPQDTAFPT